jgi:hypothetical protein
VSLLSSVPYYKLASYALPPLSEGGSFKIPNRQLCGEMGGKGREGKEEGREAEREREVEGV